MYHIQSNEGTLPQIPDTLLHKVAKQALKMSPLFGDERIQELNKFIQVFEHKSIPEFTEFLHLNSVSRPFSTGEFLDAFDAKAIYTELKELFQITQFDINRSYIQLKYIPTDYVLDIFGTDPFPSPSIDHVVEFLKQNPAEINSLLLEDPPVFMPSNESPTTPANVNIPAELEKDSNEHLYEIDGIDLEYYVKSFVTDEDLFHFDQPKGMVFTKVNPKVFLPSETGTIGFHFYINADPRTNPRITLIDLAVAELIGKLASSFTVEQLRDLLELCNYCTLIEKTYFAHLSAIDGCALCKGSEGKRFQIPRDMHSIVSGDKELPTDFKVEFYAKQIFDLIKDEDSLHSRSLVVVDSVHLYNVLKELMGLIRNRDNQEAFDRIEYGSKMMIDITKGSRRNPNEIMEKVAILETMYQIVDSENLREMAQENEDIDIGNYIKFIDKYGEELSYERLTSKNKDIKIRPGECGAETLIFGVGEATQGIESKVEKSEEELKKKAKEILNIDFESELEEKKPVMQKEEKKIKLKSFDDDKGKKKK